MTSPSPRRRSLTHVGGAVETSGDAAAAAKLAHAVDVAPDSTEDAPDRAHVHGFHAYPARTHPVTARRLVEAFAPEGGAVLDPFCGSGTVLVEAMLAGRSAIGTDLNPVAVMLARAKTYPHSPEQTRALVAAAEGVAAFAEARRKKKAGATRRLPREDVALFAPHVLLELDSLRRGIDDAEPSARPELRLVLSSILVKLGNKRGDTSDAPVDKRIAAGYPSRLFVKRAADLASREDELTRLLPSPPPRARVAIDDATVLKSVEPASIDAVITSPPYVATYDYLAHHALRMRWLGLDARAFERGELGARRRYERLGPREAEPAWERELTKLLSAISRVARPGAPVVLLIADSATAPGRRGEPPRAIRADDVVARVAERTGLAPIARASQPRPHFHAPTARAFDERARAEHALLLRVDRLERPRKRR